jgi:arylsulfatase
MISRQKTEQRAVLIGWLLLAGITAGGPDMALADDRRADRRPNILLLIADDLGYADLGAYGSDIETGNIDALAAEGILFTQFHTAPMCAPTRAMLFSGNNNHVAGMARQGVEGLLDQPVSGYENHLSDRIQPFPRLLQVAGYHTYIAGKWHLGVEKAHSPRAAGFERSFVLLEGAGTHYDANGYKEGGATYWSDEDYTEYPSGRYSTEVYTDKLLEFIGADKSGDRPFLAVAAFTSPHWPLQAPPAYLDKYAGHYDTGYDVLRQKRLASLKSAGVVPDAATLPPRNDAITPWDELSAEERRREARKMELYAAMVDNLDDHVGRILDYLKANDLYDNTLIVFMADNGAAGEDFYNRGSHRDYIRAHFDNRYENMGQPDSFVSYGPQWAEAGSAPFQRYKGYTREGGIVAPLIIAGTGVARRKAIDTHYLTVMDLAPTFLEVGHAVYPDDGTVAPMLGASLASFLAGQVGTVHDDDYVTTLFHGGRALLRQGRWKLSNEDGPFDEDSFQLFDIVSDPGETRNLAEVHPDRYDALLDLWEQERKRLGILLPEDL